MAWTFTDSPLNYSPSSGNTSESISPVLQEPFSHLSGTTMVSTTTTINNRKRKNSQMTPVFNPGGLLPHPGGGEHPPPIQCKKKRGIFKKWVTDVEVAAQASSHLDTIQLLSTLASTSINILHNKQITPILRLGKPSLPSSIPALSYEGNSLRAIAGRIGKREEKGNELDLDMAISLIQFSLKLDILQDERNKDFATLIREEIQSAGGELVAFTERQGKRWRAWGTRLVEFVGAGKSQSLVF
jgi:hypothetical protein